MTTTKCSEIMTKSVETCVPSTTVDQVARLMKSKNVGPVPVVEAAQSKKLVGIVTDRDLTLKVIAEGRDPKATKVEEVMTKRPVACKVDESVESALKLMEQHQVRRVPIVDSMSQLVGIISEADVATRFKHPMKTAELVEAVCSKTRATHGR